MRLDAFPDGGLSRVRVIGRIGPAARRAAGYRWFNALPASQTRACLADAGLPAAVASDLADQRPLTADWLDGLRSPAGQDGPAEHYRALATMLDGVS